MVSLRIQLLGQFSVTDATEAVAGVSHARLLELLAYLLLHRNAPVSRQQLAFVFWPDSSEEQARTNLRNLWHRLRRTLPEADRLLATDELTVYWRGDASCWLDVAEFEHHLKQAAASTDDEVRHLEQAAALYGCELVARLLQRSAAGRAGSVGAGVRPRAGVRDAGAVASCSYANISSGVIRSGRGEPVACA